MTFSPDSPLVQAVCPAENVEPRKTDRDPSLLILHYTGMFSADKAIQWLACCESHVSCHYVVDTDGFITQMVPERLRAWHAGQSYWRGETDINSHSIGIEIQNPGHEQGYPRFTPAQMKSVIELSRDIVRRNSIPTDNVLAHSDVAPNRKIDPGEKFSWAALARAGVGVYVRPAPVDPDDQGLDKGVENARVRRAQEVLAQLGYDVTVTGLLDNKTFCALRAFQLHFRRKRVDGRLDHSTSATLERLLERSSRQTVS